MMKNPSLIKCLVATLFLLECLNLYFNFLLNEIGFRMIVLVELFMLLILDSWPYLGKTKNLEPNPNSSATIFEFLEIL